MNYAEFLQRYPHSKLLTQIIYPPERGFASHVCFHNYYERVLKKPIDCHVHIFVFDEHGQQVEYLQQVVASDTAIKILVSGKLQRFGTIAVGLVPQDSLAEFKEKGMPIKQQQLAGYYMLWENIAKGWLDTSHELWPLDAATASRPHFVSFPADPYINARSLLLYNASLVEASAEIIMAGSRQTLAFHPLQCHEVMVTPGCDKVAVHPVADRDFISGVVTIEYHQNGDLHMHHL